MSFETSRIIINSLEIAYYRKDASNPKANIIFIHGFPLGKEMWNAQLACLPEEIQGIAYDIRGFGGGHPGHGFFSIDLFASDLIALIEKLELTQVVLCGLSMGGYIALRAFEKASHLFSGLILCDTNSASDSNLAGISRFESIETIITKGKEAFAKPFVKKVLSSRTIEEKHEVVSFVYKLILNLPEATLCATQLALASRSETTHLLKDIRVPVLVIRGAEDSIMSKEQTELLKTSIPKADYREIEDSGHLPNLENPEAFNEVMLEFLMRICDLYR